MKNLLRNINKSWVLNPKLVLTFCSFALVLAALYLVLAPYADDIKLYFSKFTDSTNGYHYVNRLSKSDNVPIDESKLKPIPLENTLVIPKIQVDAPIHEGVDDSTLNLGVWRKPFPGNPLIGGNTVLTAHRFLYVSGPNTFYHLDSLAIGDKFIIYWEGKEFDYEVTDARIISPTETWIEEPTTEPTVTLYTCTHNAENRIYIRAKLLQ